MKLALECPTGLLSAIQPLADFDWVLSHLVTTDEAYSLYYRHSKKFKILDNSVNELLKPCSISHLELAASLVNPNYIVPPDYLGDYLATEKALDEAIDVFGMDKILPVVQGGQLRQVLECAGYIAERGFDRVAVPYDITCSRESSIEEMAGAREEVVSRLILLYNFKWIHLLGMTTLEELEGYRGIGQVRSIDTGSPVLHGMLSIEYGSGNLLQKSKPTLEKMGAVSKWKGKRWHLPKVYYNIAYLRKVLNKH